MFMVLRKYYSLLINIYMFIYFIDISPNDFPGNYFDKNTIYFENHDMNNNPLCRIRIFLCLILFVDIWFLIVHFVVRTFHKGQEDNEAVKRFITYNFERHVRHYPGQKIVILFDLNETGLRNLVRLVFSFTCYLSVHLLFLGLRFN